MEAVLIRLVGHAIPHRVSNVLQNATQSRERSERRRRQRPETMVSSQGRHVNFVALRIMVLAPGVLLILLGGDLIDLLLLIVKLSLQFLLLSLQNTLVSPHIVDVSSQVPQLVVESELLLLHLLELLLHHIESPLHVTILKAHEQQNHKQHDGEEGRRPSEELSHLVCSLLDLPLRLRLASEGLG